MHDAIPETFDQAVTALESILGEESVALKQLDSRALDALAERKLALVEQLKNPPPDADVERLSRVRRTALENQMLLVHARDTVRGLLATMSGQPTSAHPMAPASVGPVRLDLRG
ncbi:MAG: hypothetical protein KC776_13330 [Myxococcales bacterium]|nr:hypothetical protein [Myxococcales bacterium]MCB9579353.1 hypothetical protein [Polyangiaceae bacterium]